MEVQCPACRSPLHPRPKCDAETIVCAQCHAIVALSHGPTRVLGTQQPATLDSMGPLPLEPGARGRLRGRALEVIGVIKRADADYSWFEVALADEQGEVTWLWVDRGHCSLLVAEGRDCVSRDLFGDYVYQGHKLRLFGKGGARILGAVGEFPFLLDPKEHASITDYIAPPFAVSYESGVWWVFEFIPPAQIKAAFPGLVAEPAGIACNQTPGIEQQRRALGLVTLVAVALLFVLQAAQGAGGSGTALLSANVDLQRGHDAPAQNLGEFTLSRRWNALALQISAPVSNAWTDLDLALVDDSTGRSYWTGGGVEFNSGVDADGYWSEGSQTASKIVRSIPAGSYTLLARASTGSWNAGHAPVAAHVRIATAPSPVGNLIVAVLLQVVAAGFFLWRAQRFEARRWANSDFSPYESAHP